jgi:hypothetical protein
MKIILLAVIGLDMEQDRQIQAYSYSHAELYRPPVISAW